MWIVVIYLSCLSGFSIVNSQNQFYFSNSGEESDFGTQVDFNAPFFQPNSGFQYENEPTREPPKNQFQSQSFQQYGTQERISQKSKIKFEQS